MGNPIDFSSVGGKRVTDSPAPVDFSSIGGVALNRTEDSPKVGPPAYLLNPGTIPIGPLQGGITQQGARDLTSVLPWAGGGLGGALGAPGIVSGIAGAAIGGAGGEALRQLTNRFLGLKEPETDTSMGAASSIGTSGAVQGAIQGATAGLSAVAKPLTGPLVASAEGQLSKVLAPTTIANKATTAKVISRLAQERPTALTRNSLLTQMGKSLEGAGSVLDDALDQAVNFGGGKAVLPQESKDAIIGRLDALENSLKVQTSGSQIGPTTIGAQAVPKAGSTIVPGAEHAVQFIQGMKNTIAAADPSFENLRNLRKILDGMVDNNGKWNLTGAETTNREIQRFTANSLRQELGKSGGPDLVKANRDYSFYKSVQSVLEDTVQRTTGQQGNLTSRILMAGGMAKGGITGAGIMKGLNQLVDSTAWRTVSAANKMRIADLIAKDELPKAAALITRLGGAANAATQDEQKPEQ